MSETDFLQYEIQFASIVLIWYDWVLMLPMEVKYIWGSRIRVYTIVYILCHYALLANVLFLFAISQMLKPRLNSLPMRLPNGVTDGFAICSCDVWYKVVGGLSVLGRTAIIYSFTARAYAVWGRRRVVLAYLAGIGIICIGLDIAHVPGLRCTGPSSIPIANDLLSILTVVFEFSSAILISVRCVQTFKYRTFCASEPIKGFWDLTFQQGILYFSFMSVFTTTSVILNFQRAPAGFYQRLLNALTLPLSGLLTSRFILHLRKCEDNLSTLERLAVETVNSVAMNRDNAGLLSSIVEPQFGWDPVMVDAVIRTEMEMEMNTGDIENTAT
ncbi:hypothetical protein F5878DRAFT_616502 [Lentinula raphanica]|uniref:DUF6533 domain-containing protein n=1 Tax=Lentinula raphanica TaxID=153919 RepID=A0AA38PBA1_9AGAR|nr:hypothetical protein F5878DRAFT_616502 [Lentinula raphanica]